MFLDLDKKKPSDVAAKDDRGESATYGDLIDFSKAFFSAVGRRTLIFIFCENTVGALAAYTASLSSKVVPLLLNAGGDVHDAQKLIDLYKPEFIWIPLKMKSVYADKEILLESYDYCLIRMHSSAVSLHPDLSLLLSTSGSTGSPKLVRHSYRNVISNAENVAELFELNSNERAIALLPMQYTMGLSVITSHLYAGASLLMISGTMTEMSFWNFIRDEKATSFTGVPFTFELLHRLRFMRMDLPYLKILTQGGGRLRDKLFQEFAEYCLKNDKKFIPTYGQTEGTARMAYLPHHMAAKKIGSIGKAIPNGRLFLIDNDGNEIEEIAAKGEMCFEGPNVTMGYALSAADLLKGDENKGRLNTGDIARRDDDGYYFIEGRKNRFLKLYGLRISLDQIEDMIKNKFKTDCYATGNDDLMIIYLTVHEIVNDVSEYLVSKTGLFHQSFEIRIIDMIPRNSSGKIIKNSELFV